MLKKKKISTSTESGQHTSTIGNEKNNKAKD